MDHVEEPKKILEDLFFGFLPSLNNLKKFKYVEIFQTISFEQLTYYEPRGTQFWLKTAFYSFSQILKKSIPIRKILLYARL